ncbi:MAG: hypothetical protein PHQ95_00780 [Candidatus Gracilibacteria bacterium]|nr:hypothetical protein [Candidatus Gracilibacteria bacterium]
MSDSFNYPRSTPPKSYSPTKQSRFILRHLPDNPVVSDENITMRQRIERTGPITVSQYKRLWGEAPAYGIRTGVYVVEGIRSGMDPSLDMKGVGYKQDLPNMRRLSGGATVLYGESPGEHSILHSYTNINFAIYVMRGLKITPADILFDGELNIDLHPQSIYDPIETLRPDCTLVKGDLITFVETDLGTETMAQLEKKAQMYRKLFDEKTLQSMGYQKFQVVFNSFSKRIRAVGKKRCFDAIKEYVKYADFIYNPVNYLPEYGVGVMSSNQYRALVKGIDILKDKFIPGNKQNLKDKTLMVDPLDFEKELFELVDKITKPTGG